MAEVHISTDAQNAAGAAITDLIDGGSGAGSLLIYSGPLPANVDTSATGDLLAEFTLEDPAVVGFPSGEDDGEGTLDLGEGGLTTTGEAAAGAGTAAGYARFVDSDGNGVIDCDVSATGGGGALQLNTTTISEGVDVEITGFTFTMPDGTE